MTGVMFSGPVNNKNLIGRHKITFLFGQEERTTKMARRVEKRINDKFYFVLDEVGSSSDCESELTSNTDIKPMDSLIKKDNMTNGTEIPESNDNTTLNDLDGNVSSDVEVLNFSSHINNTSQNRASDKCDSRREKTRSNDFLSDEEQSQTSKNILHTKESTALVDMDLDTDVESTEPNMKPLFRITFRDEDVEKRLKPSFFKFISQKFEDCTIITSNENSLEIEVYDKNLRNLLESDLLDFNLDTTPGDDHLNVPNYGKTHDFVLSDKNVGEKQDNRKLHAVNTSCFNCLGNHNFRDCPRTKDFRVITKNRLKFQSRKEKPQKNSRYHLDENQKFNHLAPGVISKKLRSALNLRRDQQAGFIYRMRLLGYPPAWLEEAKVSHSGVAMYDDIGVPVLEEDEEEGEILPDGAKDKFDISKIIEFPGFNVPLPSNFKDESKYYQCPAFSKEQSKENLIKLLEPKTVQAYVKKSLSSQNSEDKSYLLNYSEVTASLTIEEMEEKKRQLLMELNNEDSASDLKAVFTCQSPNVDELCENKKLGAIKNLEFGTPILKSVSPFSKLPSREQFSCNMSDIINFENLPNSTGKYETLREVIEKIRISASKSQKA